MRRSMQRLLSLAGAALLVSTVGMVTIGERAAAAANPSFKVTCFPRGMAQNDPIVFPGQAGRSHMHSFFGAKGVDQNTTTESLLSQETSQCGNHFDTVDLSAYWIPTLYKNDVAVHEESGMHQLVAYYQRAGGPNGALVAQAIPRGLKMIAGDMHATTPQTNVSYVCAMSNDVGRQRGGVPDFLTCNPDELFIAKLVFPDCWDGRNLDSANHKSHMAYSTGERSSCPSGHPVKLPQITFEAWYHGVNGPASSLRWSSGGAYTFHGDVISAWNLAAAANLVNQCINVAFDCNPLSYPSIPKGAVAQVQLDAQLVGVSSPVQEAPPSAPGASGSPTTGGQVEEKATPSTAPTASPTASASANPHSSPAHEHGASGPPSTRASSASDPASASESTVSSSPLWIAAIVSTVCAVLAAFGITGLILRRARR